MIPFKEGDTWDGMPTYKCHKQNIMPEPIVQEAAKAIYAILHAGIGIDSIDVYEVGGSFQTVRFGVQSRRGHVGDLVVACGYAVAFVKPLEKPEWLISPDCILAAVANEEFA